MASCLLGPLDSCSKGSCSTPDPVSLLETPASPCSLTDVSPLQKSTSTFIDNSSNSFPILEDKTHCLPAPSCFLCPLPPSCSCPCSPPLLFCGAQHRDLHCDEGGCRPFTLCYRWGRRGCLYSLTLQGGGGKVHAGHQGDQSWPTDLQRAGLHSSPSTPPADALTPRLQLWVPCTTHLLYVCPA